MRWDRPWEWWGGGGSWGWVLIHACVWLTQHRTSVNAQTVHMDAVLLPLSDLGHSTQLLFPPWRSLLSALPLCLFHQTLSLSTQEHEQQPFPIHVRATDCTNMRSQSGICVITVTRVKLIFMQPLPVVTHQLTPEVARIYYFSFLFFCPLPRFEVQCSLLKQIWINRKQANTCRDKLQDISDGQKLKENEWMDQHPWCLKSKGYVSNVRVWRDLTLVQRTTRLEQLRNEENEPWSGTCSYIFTFFSSYPELKIQGEDMSSTIISWVS